MELHDGFYACHAVFLYGIIRWTKGSGQKGNFLIAGSGYRPEINFIRAFRQVYQSEFKYIGHFAKDIGQNLILSATFLRIAGRIPLYRSLRVPATFQHYHCANVTKHLP